MNVYQPYRGNWLRDNLGGPTLLGEFYDHVESGLFDTSGQVSKLNTQRAGAESWFHAGDFADGPLVVLQSGQDWRTLGLIGSGVDATAVPRITGGKVVHPATGSGGVTAGYFTHQTQRPCTEIHAGFTFGPYTTDGGAVVLCAFATDISATPGVAPNASCHLTIGPKSWTYAVITGGSFITVATGTFTAPLISDSVTAHRASVYLDKPGAIARILLPNGEIRTVSHAAIRSVGATWPCWELYRTTTTDTTQAFVYVSAESRTSNQLAITKAVSSTAPVSIEYGPTVAATYSLTTSNTVFDATNLALTFVMPDSGKARIYGEAYLAMTGTTTVYFTLNLGATLVAAFLLVNETANRRVSFSRIYTSTPGAVTTLALGGFAGTAGLASVLASGASGYPAFMLASAL